MTSAFVGAFVFFTRSVRVLSKSSSKSIVYLGICACPFLVPSYAIITASRRFFCAIIVTHGRTDFSQGFDGGFNFPPNLGESFENSSGTVAPREETIRTAMLLKTMREVSHF